MNSHLKLAALFTHQVKHKVVQHGGDAVDQHFVTKYAFDLTSEHFDYLNGFGAHEVVELGQHYHVLQVGFLFVPKLLCLLLLLWG